MEWRAYHRIMNGNVKLFWIFLRRASQWDIFGRKAHGFHTVKNGAFVYVACNKFCDLGWQRLDRKSFKMRSKLESCDFGVPKRCLLTKINGDLGDVPWIFFGDHPKISPWKLHWFLEETQQDLGARCRHHFWALNFPQSQSLLSAFEPVQTMSELCVYMCILLYTCLHIRWLIIEFPGGAKNILRAWLVKLGVATSTFLSYEWLLAKLPMQHIPNHWAIRRNKCRAARRKNSPAWRTCRFFIDHDVRKDFGRPHSGTLWCHRT